MRVVVRRRLMITSHSHSHSRDDAISVCNVVNVTLTQNSSRDLLSFNPLKPNSSNCYTLPYRPNLPFLISDIRGVPECQKLKM